MKKNGFVFIFSLVLISFSSLDTAASNSFDKIFLAQNLKAPISSLEFSQSGNKVVTGNIAGDLSVWNYKEKKRVTRIKFTKLNEQISPTNKKILKRFKKYLDFNPGLPDIVSLTSSPKEKFLMAVTYSGVKDEPVQLINLKNAKKLKAFPQQGPATDIDFSPEGTFLAIGTWYVTNIWNINSFFRMHELRGNLLKNDTEVMVDQVEYSPNGKYLGIGYDTGVVEVWRSHTGRKISGVRAFPAQKSDVFWMEGLAFHPTEKKSPSAQRTIYAVARRDTHLKILKYPDLEVQKSVPIPSPMKNPKIMDVEVSPEENIVAIANRGRILIWSIPQQEFIRNFKAHDQQVNDLEFSPDGQYIATGSGELEVKDTDYSLKVWENPFYESNSAERTSQPGKAPPGKGRKK